MKKSLKITAVALGVLLLGASAFLAYGHRGFFAYHFDLLMSPEKTGYQAELLELVKKDPPQAFVRLREILDVTPIAHNTCHGIAHQMGHEAFEVFGFQKAMGYQNPLCGGGYIHGIIEARFGLLHEKEIIRELPTICEEGDGSCYHGIGHGLMIATKLDHNASVAHCDLLPTSKRRNCYDGVWMHIFDLEETGLHDEIESASLTDVEWQQKMVNYCKNAGSIYKASCYFYLPRIYAHQQEVTFDHYSRLCQSVENAHQSACAAGVGHSVMKYHIDNPPDAFGRCANFEKLNWVQACKEGASLYYLFDKEALNFQKQSPQEQGGQCQAFSGLKDRAICEKVDGYRNQL